MADIKSVTVRVEMVLPDDSKSEQVFHMDPRFFHLCEMRPVEEVMGGDFTGKPVERVPSKYTFLTLQGLLAR